MKHGPRWLRLSGMALSITLLAMVTGVAAGLVGEITQAQCTGCHNPKSPFVGDDYVFDFAARKDQGTHEKFPLKYKH